MSSIIKGTSPEAAHVRPLTLSGAGAALGAFPGDEDVLSAAETIMREAEETLTEARRRAEEMEREAYQRGFSQGEKAGMAFGEKKLEPVAKAP